MMVCLVCQGKKCKKRGSKKIMASCEKYLAKKGLEELCKIKGSKCLGHCKKAPVALIKKEPGWLFYQDKKTLKKHLKELLSKQIKLSFSPAA